MTEWRQIPGYEGEYDVSDDGRVYSHPRRGSHGGHVLAPAATPRGHLQVSLSKNRVSTSYLVHVLVATLFIGPRPDGMQVRHLNGQHTDNRVANLQWGTQSENTLDSVAHQTHNHARNTHCPAGHVYDDGNTHIDKTGRRHCRTCSRHRTAARRLTTTLKGRP